MGDGTRQKMGRDGMGKVCTVFFAVWDTVLRYRTNSIWLGEEDWCSQYESLTVTLTLTDKTNKQIEYNTTNKTNQSSII